MSNSSHYLISCDQYWDCQSRVGVNLTDESSLNFQVIEREAIRTWASLSATATKTPIFNRSGERCASPPVNRWARDSASWTNCLWLSWFLVWVCWTIEFAVVLTSVERSCLKEPCDPANDSVPDRIALKDKVGIPSVCTDVADVTGRSWRWITVDIVRVCCSFRVLVVKKKGSLTAVLMKNFIEWANSFTDRNFFTVFAVVAKHTKHDLGRLRNFPGMPESLENDVIQVNLQSECRIPH